MLKWSDFALQTHHMVNTYDRLHVVSTWNTRSVFVGCFPYQVNCINEASKFPDFLQWTIIGSVTKKDSTDREEKKSELERFAK